MKADDGYCSELTGSEATASKASQGRKHLPMSPVPYAHLVAFVHLPQPQAYYPEHFHHCLPRTKYPLHLDPPPNGLAFSDHSLRHHRRWAAPNLLLPIQVARDRLPQDQRERGMHHHQSKNDRNRRHRRRPLPGLVSLLEVQAEGEAARPCYYWLWLACWLRYWQ